PVRRIGAAERPSELLHARSSLVRIEQPFDQTRSSDTPGPRIAVDPIAQLRTHLDRRRHEAIMPEGLPFGIRRSVGTSVGDPLTGSVPVLGDLLARLHSRRLTGHLRILRGK